MEAFDRNWDPFDHPETYKTLMLLHNYSDRIMCRAFLATLKGSIRKWFGNLIILKADLFSKLSKLFASHFIGGRCYQNPATYLLNVKQSKEELLRDYDSRFNQEVLQLDDVDKKVVLTAFMGGLLPTKFLFSLSKSPPSSTVKLMLRTQKHMNAEDTMATRRDRGTDPREQTKRKRERMTQDYRTRI